MILILSSILLVAVIIGAVVGVVLHKQGISNPQSIPTPPDDQLTPAASLKAVCGVTQYPSSCFSSISSLETSNTTDPEVLFKLSLRVALDELAKLKDYPAQLLGATNDGPVRAALSVCESLIDDAWNKLNDSISSLIGSDPQVKNISSVTKIGNMKTWLSSALTDQDTCLDALQELNGTKHFDPAMVEKVRTAMENSTEFVSNSLAIVSKILSLLPEFNIPIHRRLLGFPEWISAGDRRLLQESNFVPDVTVAQDGTGDFRNLSAAVATIPKKGAGRYIIHIKQGVYNETVVLDKNKWNVMMVGDGKSKTIISGNRNFIDGTPTFSTATVAVAGKGFIAKDINFINTAGPEKHQAVAFRSGSDMSVFYRCAFEGYQDTLYAHSNRQFYRECDITGTIDFIFGNAAVVFQDCNIQPRQPLPNQFNTITAQGKKDPNQNTGISIHRCTLSALGNDLTAPTYLGRPWKEYSTTVIMKSDIGGFLNPWGWMSWVAGVDPPSTIFYAEYLNSGPGSSVDQRVKWSGYKPTLSVDEAGKFAVESFIQGSEWLPATSVTFDTAL